MNDEFSKELFFKSKPVKVRESREKASTKKDPKKKLFSKVQFKKII